MKIESFRSFHSPFLSSLYSSFAKLCKNFHQRLQFSLAEVFVYCQREDERRHAGRGAQETVVEEQGKEWVERVLTLPMAPDYLTHCHARLSSNEALRFTCNVALMESSSFNVTPRMMLLAQLGTCHLWNGEE